MKIHNQLTIAFLGLCVSTNSPLFVTAEKLRNNKKEHRHRGTQSSSSRHHAGTDRHDSAGSRGRRNLKMGKKSKGSSEDDGGPVPTTAGATTAAPTTLAPTIGSDPLSQSAALREAVKVEEIVDHALDFMAIAEATEGHRAVSSMGYQKSVDHLIEFFEDIGFIVQLHNFTVNDVDTNGPSGLTSTTPGSMDLTVFKDGVDFNPFSYSPFAEITGIAEKVANIGCDAADFTDFTAGNIAIIERGVCTFSTKVTNAENAGAIGAIVYNDPERAELFGGTLDTPSKIPAFSVPLALAPELIGKEVQMFSNTVIYENIESFNVIAETPFGNPEQIIMMGAHLDSTRFAPGMHDNAVANGMLMEIAKQMYKLGIETENKVKFAFWGAEEVGLLGSTAYATSLFLSGEKDNIKAYLNFNLIAASNGVRAIYPPMNQQPSLLPAEGKIMSLFQEWFTFAGLPVFELPPVFVDQLRGGSDHAIFQSPLIGIPSGGLVTGDSNIKAPELAAVFGGTGGAPFDPCYEETCDVADNFDVIYLDTNAQAATHAVFTLAQVTNFTEYFAVPDERRLSDDEITASSTKDQRVGRNVRENEKSKFYAGEKM